MVTALGALSGTGTVMVELVALPWEFVATTAYEKLGVPFGTT
jgi:hypothetical protein